MSQNKTKCPGMEGNSKSSTNVYSREGYNPQTIAKRGRSASKATQIPGVTNEPSAEKKMNENGKPIRGFLFSISKGVAGEYWPLRQGKNVIGKSSSCDVYLPEATVSEEHATIIIRILENQGKTIAALKDSGSTNGTKINGEEIDFDANTIKNGDVICFGSNYECGLILIDTKEMGLKIADNFVPVDEEDMQDLFVEESESSAPVFYNPASNAGGTIGMDGEPGFGAGTKPSTVLM